MLVIFLSKWNIDTPVLQRWCGVWLVSKHTSRSMPLVIWYSFCSHCGKIELNILDYKTDSPWHNLFRCENCLYQVSMQWVSFPPWGDKIQSNKGVCNIFFFYDEIFLMYCSTCKQFQKAMTVVFISNVYGSCCI